MLCPLIKLEAKCQDRVLWDFSLILFESSHIQGLCWLTGFAFSLKGSFTRFSNTFMMALLNHLLFSLHMTFTDKKQYAETAQRQHQFLLMLSKFDFGSHKMNSN